MGKPTILPDDLQKECDALTRTFKGFSLADRLAIILNQTPITSLLHLAMRDTLQEAINAANATAQSEDATLADLDAASDEAGDYEAEKPRIVFELGFRAGESFARRKTQARDETPFPNRERAISSIEIADFIREEYCHEAAVTLDPQDQAVNGLLSELCDKFGIDLKATIRD